MSNVLVDIVTALLEEYVLKPIGLSLVWTAIICFVILAVLVVAGVGYYLIFKE